MVNLLLAVFLGSVSPAPSIPPLVVPGTTFSQPDLKQPLGQEWVVAKGGWTPADGVLTVHELPDQHHIPVLRVMTGPSPLIIDCEFKLAPTKGFLVGCDGPKHVGRVIVGAKNLQIVENTPDAVTGKAGNHVLAKQVVDVPAGAWQHLRVEYAGETMAAWLNQTSLQAEHPYLATPKKQWWFAAGDGVQIRNIQVITGSPAGTSMTPPAVK